ncbi:PepSY domain-containing protein [Pararhodospirillum photometricum]|nr:PepSY domain-containing protein [Pararhodospirillum photometricum]
MKRNAFLISALTASAVSFPALAFAFGGPGNCPGPMGGPGGLGGPGGDPGLMREAVAATKIDLVRALAAAREVAPGPVIAAHLVPFAVPAAPRGNSFAQPPLAPTFMVTILDKGVRSVVSVDGATGKASVAGTATGILAQPGHPGMGMGMGMPGGRQGRGPFGPPVDLTGTKIDALQAVEAATKAVKGGKVAMVKGVERDGDKAWLVGIATQADTAPAEGAGPGAAFTLVFVDPESGAILNTQERQPGMGPGRGWN